MSCNHAYVNFKFQPRKDRTIITIFSSLLLGKQGYSESKVETKFIMTFITFFVRKTRLF